MKKFFSLIALAGVIAACTPEQIQTAFKLAGAKGAIDVEVVKLNGDPIEGQFSIAGYESLPNANISYAGNKATITFSAAESKEINLIDLTLTVSGDEIVRPESTKISVPSILAGQEAKLYALIRVGENVDDWYVHSSTKTEEDKYEIGYLVNDAYEKMAYTHDIFDFWYVNNTENLLTGVAKIDDIYGYSACTNLVVNNYAGFENTVAGYVENMEEDMIDVEKVDYEFIVSAWAMWNVAVVNFYDLKHSKLLATRIGADGELTDEEILLASCDYKYYWLTIYGVEELPYPNATGHYVEGHGHAHGGDNAGGGISFNE